MPILILATLLLIFNGLILWPDHPRNETTDERSMYTWDKYPPGEQELSKWTNNPCIVEKCGPWRQVDNFAWVIVVNHTQDKCGGQTPGETCSIKETGKVREIGMRENGMLYQYITDDWPCGAPCAPGVLFYKQ